MKKYGLEGFIEFTEEQQMANQKHMKAILDKGEIVSQVYIHDRVYNIFEEIMVNIRVEMKSFTKNIILKHIKTD